MSKKIDKDLQKVYDSQFDARRTLEYIYSQLPSPSLSERLSRRLKRKFKKL